MSLLCSPRKGQRRTSVERERERTRRGQRDEKEKRCGGVRGPRVNLVSFSLVLGQFPSRTGFVLHDFSLSLLLSLLSTVPVPSSSSTRYPRPVSGLDAHLVHYVGQRHCVHSMVTVATCRSLRVHSTYDD